MIPMDRETLMMIATIVAIAGVVFLFKEMNKAKQDVENLRISQPISCTVSVHPKMKPVPQTEPEIEKEDAEEKEEE